MGYNAEAPSPTNLGSETNVLLDIYVERLLIIESFNSDE